MPLSEIGRRVILVRNDVAETPVPSMFRVGGIRELGTTLSVVSGMLNGTLTSIVFRTLYYNNANVGSYVRFEVFTAVAMKNGVFWNITPCGSCRHRHFGGT
jgi:hypothetical protein